ncbi:hypothetical protein [Roseivivax halodurans]|nr:hypothetical protein [Roseivivax halodurans]
MTDTGRAERSLSLAATAGMAKRTIIPRLGPISSLFEARLDRDRADFSEDAGPNRHGVSGAGENRRGERRGPEASTGTEDREQ